MRAHGRGGRGDRDRDRFAGGRGRGGGGGYVGRDKVRFCGVTRSTETPRLALRRSLLSHDSSSFVSRTADDADRYFRVGFVPARALTARHPTVSTPQTKGRTMATASKLSVPKPVNLPSMKKVRGGERTRTAIRMCAVPRPREAFLSFRVVETDARRISVFSPPRRTNREPRTANGERARVPKRVVFERRASVP